MHFTQVCAHKYHQYPSVTLLFMLISFIFLGTHPSVFKENLKLILCLCLRFIYWADYLVEMGEKQKDVHYLFKIQIVFEISVISPIFLISW